MSRPISETPILYGKDAIEFKKRMLNSKKVSKEERERIKSNYDLINSIKTFE